MSGRQAHALYNNEHLKAQIPADETSIYISGKRSCQAETDPFVPAFLSNLTVVLVEPQAAGNIGATARAMKTMGLSRLALVNPVEFHTAPEARRLAHGAEDILDVASVVSSLDDALTGVVFAVGTTNRPRGHWLSPVYPLRDAAPEIVAVARQQPVAVLFGREDRGLLNDELERCHLITHIPAACVHPALNLSQAVMVCAYEIFLASLNSSPAVRLRLADIHEVERVCRRIGDTLINIGFVPRPAPDTFLRSIRRVFQRCFRLEKRDVAVLHKICDQIDEYIKTVTSDK